MRPPSPADPIAVSPRTYYPELDGVRAVATIMVMVFHMAQQGIPIPGPVMLGQTGVDLFFVLSGFLITTILLKSPQQDWHEVRTFYIRRTLRIFPLYYAFLLLSLPFHPHIAWPFWIYLQNFWFAFDLPLNGPNHFWSLAIEEQFYLVWPFVVLFLPRRWLVTVLWVMILGAIACRVVLVHEGISAFYFTLSRVDGLAAGALLAVLNQRQALARLRQTFLALCVVSAAGVIVEGALAHHAGAAWIQVTKFSLLTAFYTTALGLLLTSGPTLATAWLRGAPARFIGRISYGLYIFHPVAYEFAFHRLAHQPAPMRALAGVALTFAVALLSWHLLERRFILLKDKLAPERARFPRSAPAMSSV